MATSDQLVLVTGANGHIGFRVLVYILRAGYSVRACVRNQAKEDLIRNANSIKEINPNSRLQFAHIPDLLVDGAYDDVVKDIDVAVHVGGPIAHGNEDLNTLDETMVKPSVVGTMNMLYACEKAKNVKRVVLTSSVLGLMSWDAWLVKADPRVFTEYSRVKEEEKAQPPFWVAWQAYANAKADSLNISEAWARERRGKLHFDIVNVHPSIVIGPHELALTKEEVIGGVNFIAIMNVMGQKSDLPIAGATVHIDDVADLYVRVMDTEKVKTNDDGLLSVIAHSQSPGGTTWDDNLEVVRKTWPDLVEKAVLPCDGLQPSKPTLIDATATEKLLGMKFQDYEAQIKNLFPQWIGYLEKEGAGIRERIH